MNLRMLWILVPLSLASTAAEEPTCTHATAGDSRVVSLDQVARSQHDLRKKLAMTWRAGERLSADAPYDSGLPSCRSRQSLRLKTSLPPEWVGRSIAFAPAERMPVADVRVATSARRMADLRADALADPRLIRRLGVRCTPTLVRALSEVELELLENP